MPRLVAYGVIVVLAWRLSEVLLLIFCAALLATVVRGAAEVAARRLRLPVRLALALVSVGLAAVVIAAAYWIGPALAGQASDLVNRLTSELHVLRQHFGNSPFVRELTGGGHGGTPIDGLMGYAYTVATSTFGFLSGLFVVVVLSLYFAVAPEMYVSGAVLLVPPAHRPLAHGVLREVGHNLRLWSAGQIVDMLVVGGLAATGLSLLGIPVPFALATLAGLLTVVPYFGAIAAGIPGVIVGLTQGLGTALWVVLIFAICHVVEGYLVAPLVQRHMVEMPPAVIILSISVAAVLFGPLGIILGAPLAVAALVVVRRVYVEHILGAADAGRP